MMNSVLGENVNPLGESNRKSYAVAPPPSSLSGRRRQDATSKVDQEAVIRRLLSDDPPGWSPVQCYKKMESFEDTQHVQNGILDDVNHPAVMEADISMLSMESKDETATTTQSEDTSSDCGTEASAVAMKRAWLNDFQRQQKKHYEKTALVGKKPDSVTLEKPTRPKVSKGAAAAQGPTPLPPPSAAALVKHIIEPQKQSTTTTPSLSRKSMTPVRVKPAEVQATDEGYASVAQLSAWLADDPTSTKKVRPIRRGKNVIAKSRKFDKELANVVVAETPIRTGNVKSKKDWLEANSSSEDTATDDETVSLCSKQLQWPTGTDADADTASAVNVTDKKTWLSKAFKKNDDTSNAEQQQHAPPQRANTVIVTSQDARNDDLSLRVKKMWRKKAPKRRAAPRTPTKSTHRRLTMRPATESKIRRSSAMTTSFLQEQDEDDTDDDSDPPVDFQAARDKLVKRSRENGNSVHVLNKVRLRTAKFEQLEKEASRRKSMPFGLLKPSWDECTDSDEGLPSDSYIKKYVDDVAPKKSFEELP